jgi:hypothetical protein
MKEHEKSFCRARVAFEENRKNKTEDGTSPISSESASPDDKLTVNKISESEVRLFGYNSLRLKVLF